MNAKNVQLQLAPEDYLIITVSTSRNNFTSFLQLATIQLDTISCNQEAYLTTSPISEGWECVFRDSEWQRATAGKLQCDWR